MINFGYKRSLLWGLFSMLLAAQSLAQQGTALHFDGVDDRLTASGNTLAVNTFTIEGWVLPTAARTVNEEGTSGITGVGQPYLLAPPQAGGNSGVGISVGTNGVGVYEHGDNYLPCLLSWTGTITSWTHIAVVCVNKQYSLYINGNLVRTGLTSTRGNSLVYLSAGVGGSPYGYYKGSLDEFRVWDRALPSCEIQNNMNCELGSVQTGLKTYYKFNNGTGAGNNAGITTLTDASGNNNTGTLTGFTLDGATSNWVANSNIVTGATCTPITATPTVSIAVTAGSQAMCNGASVTFTATPTNAGNTPTYVWKKNNVAISGAVNATYTTTALAQGDVISATVTTACNVSATSNNIVMTVAPTPALNLLGNTTNCNTVTLTAANNAALNFQGTTAAPTYVSIPDANSLDMTTTFTLEAWVKPTGTTGYLGTVISKNAKSGSDGYFIGLAYRGGNATILAGVNNQPTSPNRNIYATTTNVVPLNTWSHIATTFNGTTLFIYLNGSLIGTTNHSGGATITLPNSTQPLCIGNAGAGLFDRQFQGEIDEVRVWNTVRTQADIQAHKSHPIAAQTGLVGYYRFNETTGTAATDASGNNNNGTWSGAVTRVNPTTSPADVSTYAWSNAATTAANTFNASGNYTVTVTDANGCIASASTAVTINPNVTASVAIVANPAGAITAGTSVTFTATPTNGGTPTYQWFKNGVAITGATNATYTDAALANGNIITCQMTSNALCATPVPALSNAVTMTVNPAPGAALHSDGGNDYVEIANSTSLNSYIANGELTIEYWVNPVQTNTLLNILSKRPANNVGGFVIENPDARTLNMAHYLYTNAGWKSVMVLYTANTWQHIAVTAKQGDALRVYKNGVLQGTTSLAGQTFVSTSSVLRLMANTLALDRFAKGSLDEVRIWNRALPQCEIQHNMNGELPSGQTGLVAYYPFNQGFANTANPTVTTLTDASGNNNTGTLMNYERSGATSNWISTGGVTTGSTATVLPTPSVLVTANPSGAVPANTSITFTATATNAGTPTYQWFKNGVAISGATNATYMDATLLNGNIITCQVNSGVCAFPMTVTSAGITMTVGNSITATTTPVCGVANGTITPSVWTTLSKVRYVRLNQNYVGFEAFINLAEIRVIEALTGKNIALNKTVTSQSLYSTPFPNANFVDGNLNNFGHSGGTNTAQFLEIDLGAEYLIDNIQVVNRMDCCQYRSQNFQLILKTAAGVVVSSRQIDAYQNQNNGFTTTWNVTDVSWSDNGTTLNRTGLDAGTYTLTYSDIDGTTISLPVSVTNANVTPVPSVSIAASNQTICLGANATFTATPVSGGTTPSYQWKKNNVNVGTNSPTYSSTGLANGDVVTCVLTSNACAVTPIVTSTGIQMVVNGAPIVEPIAGSSSVGVGTTTRFMSLPSSGVWSSSNTAVATVNTSGVVTGVSVGTATISYTVTSDCGTTTVTKDVTTVFAPKYCLNYRPVREGNYLYLHLTMLADSSQFNLGSANLQFKYKNTVLSNPTLMSSPLPTAQYAGISFTTPNLVGIAADDQLGSFNFNFVGASGSGLLIPSLGNSAELAVIRFNIANDALTPDFRTYENGTRGTNVYDDAVTPVLVPKGDCEEFENNYSIATKIAYAATDYCTSEVPVPVQFTAGTTGGTYSAEAGLSLNVNTGEITPATSTPGLYHVYYAVPATNGGQSMTTVTIKPTPEPSFTGLTDAYCSTVASFTLAATPAGGTFKIDEVVATTFDPTTLSAGPHNVMYTVANAELCSATVDKMVMINEAPRIAAGTTDLNVCIGSPMLLSASITGTNLTYSWKKDNVTIDGATTSSYSVASATAATAGDYTLSIVGCATETLTTDATVTTSTAPSITTQPLATNSVCPNGSVTLSVVAAGSEVRYQWKKAGVEIENANYATYTIPTVTTSDAGIYTVSLSGTCAPVVTSTNATIVLNEVPEISTEPVASTTVCAGAAINLSVAATGTGLTYQWKKDGSDIPNATAATYSVPSATTSNAGTYTAVVSGTCGTDAISADAVVVVDALPSITTQPVASQTLCIGDIIDLRVIATGSNLTYQWRKNGTNVPNLNSNHYTFPTTALTDAGIYSVVVSGTCPPSVTSIESEVNVYNAPAITIQPVAITTCVGSGIELGVVATGTGLTYQWKKAGINIPDATSAAYIIPTAATTDAGVYTVVVSGSCGTIVTSAETQVIVNSLPSITTEPMATTTLCAGAPLSLNVGATGTGLTYQWKKDGVDIADATTATYSVASTVAADAALYTVLVNGSCNIRIFSEQAAVIVNTFPNITTQPIASTTVCVGAPIALSIDATGTDLTYQWKKDGNAISGANAAAYTIPASVVGDAAVYSVSIGNMCQANLNSTDATVIVNTLPNITAQPVATTTVCEGTGITLNVAATGSNIVYQWQKDGVAISNSNSTSYAIANPIASDAGVYTVSVSGTCLPALTSTTATVVVNVAPAITIQPNASTSVCVGTDVHLGVNAVGTALTYQWQKGGVDITGATASTYTIANPDATAAGTYKVILGNMCQTNVVSADAVLVMNVSPSITTEPVASTTVCEGTVVNLNVVAAGTNLTYQWKKGGIDITGANTAALNLTTVSSDAGIYTVSIGGTCIPSVLSSEAILTVNVAPVIVSQPIIQTNACVGTPIRLSVTATGTGLTYQWQKDGSPLSGETAATYDIASATLTSAGTYTVVITGVGNCAVPLTSSNAVVAVGVLPDAIVGATSVYVGFETTFTNAVAGGVWKSSDVAIATVSTSGVVTGVTTGTAIISYTLTNPCGENVVTKEITILPNKVVLNVKVILEGNYNTTTGLMSDELRTNGLIPTTEPFTSLAGFTHRGGTGGSETIANTVLTVTGNDAIVDWIFVELRSKTSPSTVLYTRSGLLQRDGDIVDIDGTSPLAFNAVYADDYYVAVRHRNHLGFRTLVSKALGYTPTTLNFTNGSQTTFGIEALRILNGVSMMYSGEGDGNGVINAIDLNTVWLLQNGTNSYLRSDFDLNGIVNAIDRNQFWRVNNSRIEQLD